MALDSEAMFETVISWDSLDGTITDGPLRRATDVEEASS